MGQRGPAPKPTDIQILEGNPGKRAINRNQPVYPDSQLVCPDVLSGDARDEWYRIVPALQKVGLISGVDSAALASYCLAWEQVIVATAEIHSGGLTFEGPSGLKANPAVGIRDRAMAQIRAFAREFGFTPSSRAGLTLPETPKDEDEWGDLTG